MTKMVSSNTPDTPIGGSPTDHLSIPTNPTHTAFEVPYYSRSFRYDSKGFLDFPGRHGSSVEELLDPKTCDRTADELNDLFQSWLFFGFISETVCVGYNAAEFVCTNSKGAEVITTRPLSILAMR